MQVLDGIKDAYGAPLNPAWHAGLRSGRYYSGPYSTTAGSALAVDTIYWQPVLVPEVATVVEIGVNVTATGTATLARLGLYRLAAGTLTAMALPAEFSVTSTGLKAQTVSVPVTPGMYFIGVIVNGTVSITCDSATGPSGPNGVLLALHGSSDPTVSAGTAIGLITSQTYGALPTPSLALSSTTYSGTILPHLWYRV